MFAWTALAPLIVAVTLSATSGPAVRSRRAFALGWLSGVGFFGGAVYWVVAVMNTYGGLPFVVSAMIGGLLIGYLAIYPGLFALVLARVVRRLGLIGVWFAPAIWVASEYGRSTILGGFGWALLGSSQAPVLPVAQAASVVGVYGLSAIVALVSTAAAVLALTTRRSHRLAVAAVGLGLVVVVAAGSFRLAGSALTRTGPVLKAGLVQGGVEQQIKWDPAYRDVIFERHMALTRRVIAAGAQIVFWPESSTPFFFDAEPALSAPLRHLARDTRTPFVIGTDEFEPGTNGEPNRIYNTALHVAADGQSRAVYRKMRLVPFGEYVPFSQVLFFVDSMVEAVSDFSAGTEPVVFDIDGRRLSVAICYESIYPDIARAFVARGSQLLVTITNDAWFGRSSAAFQHFEQGALRAVEEGRYVLRAANTGISGAVDPYGRVLLSTPLFEQTAETVDVRLLTYRTIYSRIGDVAVWASLALTGWLLIRTRTPRRQLTRP